MLETLIKFLNEYARFAPIFPILVGAIRFRRLISPQKWLVVLVIFCLLIEFLAMYMARQTQNNLPLYHLFICVEFSLLTIILYQSYKGLIPKKYLSPLLYTFWGLAILNVVFFQKLHEFASHTRTLESVFILIVVIRYFFLVLKELKIKDLDKSFSFWVSTSLLLYFSVGLPQFIYSNYIISQEDAAFFEVFAIRGVLNILLYLFYGVALLRKF